MRRLALVYLTQVLIPLHLDGGAPGRRAVGGVHCSWRVSSSQRSASIAAQRGTLAQTLHRRGEICGAAGARVAWRNMTSSDRMQATSRRARSS
jgi:hypothetical protein